MATPGVFLHAKGVACSAALLKTWFPQFAGSAVDSQALGLGGLRLRLWRCGLAARSECEWPSGCLTPGSFGLGADDWLQTLLQALGALSLRLGPTQVVRRLKGKNSLASAEGRMLCIRLGYDGGVSVDGVF